MFRAPVLLGVAGALVGLVVAVLLFRSYGVGEVRSGARGFVVESDRLVRITFEVDKDPGATALCTVRSRDRTGSEVGNALVRVGPSVERRQVVTYDLPTTGRANTGELAGCSPEPTGSGQTAP